MLMGTFAFANGNSFSKVEIADVGKCTYSIITTVTTSSGDQYSYSTTYVTDATSQKHCEMIARLHVHQLQMAGN